MAIFLLGDETVADTNNPKDYFYLAKFTASKNGIATQIGIYSLASGNAKVSLYADDSGEPAALLVANDSGGACTGSQANYISISRTVIQGGVDYWIGLCTETNGVCGRYSTSGGTVRYKSGQTYSGFSAPSPAGSGYSSSEHSMSFALYGDPLTGLFFGKGLS